MPQITRLIHSYNDLHQTKTRANKTTMTIIKTNTVLTQRCKTK